jgi:ABC-type transporter Mla subunit MlaD
MQEQLQQRLNELISEFEAGKTMMADLEAKQTNLRETLLRISGAIQVLEELLAGAKQAQQNGREDGQNILQEPADGQSPQ